MSSVYIMKEEVPSMDLAAAHYGFKALGHKIVLYEEIEEVPRSAIAVIGYIDDLQKFFEKTGVGKQIALNIPPELSDYGFVLREIGYCTMKEFRESAKLPIFLKPARYPKEFPAGVITKESSKKFFSEVSDDTPVMTSEVVDILSEYRCYIRNGKLLGIKHYQGDVKVFPNPTMIQRMIDKFTKAPRGYSLDVGVLSSGPTVLIEAQLWIGL